MHFKATPTFALVKASISNYGSTACMPHCIVNLSGDQLHRSPIFDMMPDISVGGSFKSDCLIGHRGILCVVPVRPSSSTSATECGLKFGNPSSENSTPDGWVPPAYLLLIGERPPIVTGLAPATSAASPAPPRSGASNGRTTATAATTTSPITAIAAAA